MGFEWIEFVPRAAPRENPTVAFSGVFRVNTHAGGDIRRKVLRQAGGFAMLAAEAFYSAGHFIKVPSNQRMFAGFGGG